ncbi:hypothetical protein HYT23_05725 [Candidatus Pacearchaeota archaeon]|nr:hypothetical protein [Candidatus Pacearchaeota archaeon]
MKMNKAGREEKGNIVRGAMQHIKPLIVAIKRYKSGSHSEKEYAYEHYEKLENYLDKF